MQAARGTVVGPAVPDDAPHLERLARITFPLACPPTSQPADIERFLTTTLSAAGFRAWIDDPAATVLVARSHDASTGDRHRPEGATHDSTTSDGAISDGGTSGGATGAGRIEGFAITVVGEPTDPEVAAVVSDRPVVELSKMYVHPDRHGQGLSADLMAAALESAVATGCVGVWLGVNQANVRAQTFYRRHGFEVVGTKHFRVGTVVEDDFTMYRRLSAERETAEAG